MNTSGAKRKLLLYICATASSCSRLLKGNHENS
nr:MAG TPA: hypothetical protein [Caudoviricetes sp.]